MTDYSRLSRRDLVVKLRAAEAELKRIQTTRETENQQADSGNRLFTAAELRRRAETRWQAQLTQAHLPLTEAESRRLIHELHVHQIELELQNEELREVSAQLQQSLERYIDLYDFAPAGYFTLTNDRAIQEINLAGAALLDQQRPGLIGRRLGLFVSEDSLPTFNAFLDQLTKGISPETCEVALDLENAPSRQVRFEGVPIGSGMDRCCRLIAVDITERKQMTEMLRQVNERLELVIEGADVGVYDANLRTGKAVVNQRYLQILGYAPGELAITVQGWRELIHPEDLPRVDRACREAEQGACFNEEYRLRHKSGDWIWVLDRGKGFDWDEHGGPWRIAGTHVDITAHKHAEQALSTRETLLRTIMENSPDPIFMVDRACRLLYANPAVVTVLNAFGDQPLWTQETLIGKTPLEFFGDPAVGQAMLEADQRVMTSEQTIQIEERITTQDATRIYLSTRSPLRDSAGQIIGLVGIAHNITEQKHSEEQRLAQLTNQRDILVREVHHRIKNHLQGVTGLLHNRIARRPELAEDLEEVSAQICAIAHAYGLQSHRPEGRVRLDALLKTLAHGSTGVAPIHCALPVLESGATVFLAREEAVSLALVLNELLANALKHNDTSRPARPIQVALEISATEQRVVIRNGPALLATTFDFAAGRGLGTGLELLRALLPPQGASLTFHQQADEVVAELRLTPPVVDVSDMYSLSA